MEDNKIKKHKPKPSWKGLSSKGPIMKPLHKTNFSSLPTELRWMIWQLSIPDARVVPIRLNAASRRTWSASPVPNLLHICRESRRVGLAHYELAFSLAKDSMPKIRMARDHVVDFPNARSIKADGIPRIFFDYEKDILYFDALLKDVWELIGGLIPRSSSDPRWTKRVKYLAVDIDAHWRFDLPAQRLWLRCLPVQFSGLEQLLVMQDNRWGVYTLEGKGKNVIEKVKDMAWMDERLGQSPRERDFVDTFDKLAETRKDEWDAPQLKFIELVREWG